MEKDTVDEKIETGLSTSRSDEILPRFSGFFFLSRLALSHYTADCDDKL